MNLFGFEISLRRAAAAASKEKAIPQQLNGVGYYNGWGPWWGPVHESFTGAWQQNVVVAPTTTLLSFSAVYACVTGIASDIAKMRIKLSRDIDGIWTEITEAHGNSLEASVIPLLKKPNRYQTDHKFVEQWLVSKLLYGNTYVLKQRDQYGLVSAMYVLHPACVKVLVAENGEVFYELSRDDLSGLNDEKVNELGESYGRVVVPASEIIHDMMVSLWHPLIGVSPLSACAISTTMGNNIQNSSTNYFANGGRPSGIIYVPGAISDETAQRLKQIWETNFGGNNIGRTALLADGMKFEAVQMMSAEVMQTIEQLRWTVEDVARAFRYPLWMLGGPMPPYTQPEMAMVAYYSQCLHPHIENFERCLDEGLGLTKGLGTELDLDVLMRMDTVALYESNNKAVQGGWMSPDEARFKANFKKTPGGNTPYLQQQNYSLSALSKRDSQADPFAKTSPQSQSPPPEPPVPPTSATPSDDDNENESREMLDPFDVFTSFDDTLRKGFNL